METKENYKYEKEIKLRFVDSWALMKMHIPLKHLFKKKQSMVLLPS